MGTVQCPKCPKKMGTLAKFCSYCGAKLPARMDAETLRELALKREEDKKEFGGTCTPRHHDLLFAIIILVWGESGDAPKGYCPDCGVKLL